MGPNNLPATPIVPLCPDPEAGTAPKAARSWRKPGMTVMVTENELRIAIERLVRQLEIGQFVK